VEYDPTASHLHHANEFGIQLPTSFDMKKYMLMNKQDRIQYAKQNVSRETIISYQNAIGMVMKPTFGITTRPVRGFAGIRKEPIGLVIKDIPNSENYYLSVIRNDRIHISSYPIKSKKLGEIVQDDFWLWKSVISIRLTENEKTF